MDKKDRFVLDKLADGAWWLGLDLVKESNGLLKRGTVYVTLARMEENGLIESSKADELTKISRRLYRKVKK